MVKPYYIDQHVTVYNKSCTSMDELPDESIRCCVTSPPYWGLRKYSGNQDLLWGNHNGCEHEFTTTTTTIINNNGTGTSTLQSRGKKTQGVPDGEIQTRACSLCGAWRGSFGLEPTPEMYVSHSIEILREIRRVLRKDGVVFWNIGDSYYGSGKGIGSDHGKAVFTDNDIVKTKTQSDVLKPKDLCLIPFRVAIAAQEDGWWVRSVIIWNKPNAMPESVKDRPTESHEYILMLTKSANYYWDTDAVRECYTTPLNRWGGPHTKATDACKGDEYAVRFTPGRKCRPHPGGRNLRSVWTFPTQPYPEAHFATFPEELPERCIKAGSKEGDIVLDPFAGSGTTLWVSKRLGRKAVGYELSSEYCELIIKRNRQQVML